MDRFHPIHEEQDPNAPDPIDNSAPAIAPAIAPLAPAQLNQIQQPQNVIVQAPGIPPDPNAPEEHWLKAFWRPACAWIYLVICFMDFVGFPILAMVQPIISKSFGVPMQYVPWVPLTLNQSGMVHMAFGAILGVSAWTRGMNKQ